MLFQSVILLVSCPGLVIMLHDLGLADERASRRGCDLIQL